MTAIWLRGLFSRHQGRLFGAAAGVAATVALFASISAFIVTSSATMTRRAIVDVPVDWQILLAGQVRGADVATASRAIASSTATSEVNYAAVRGFSSATDGTVQTTGAGVVVGISQKYPSLFPGEIRRLIGSTRGILVAQQTAANLQLSVGDPMTIRRFDGSTQSVRVAGVVDLPNADSFFSAIGVPTPQAPQAPPDNVVLVPNAIWSGVAGVKTGMAQRFVRRELHVRISHNLPSDPATAARRVEMMARALEVRFAGDITVGDNLAARLQGAGSDAAYARVLFLFLGLPGVAVAALITWVVAGSGAVRRRREQALLRVRGAKRNEILRLAALEATVIGLTGGILGVGAAAGCARLFGWFGVFGGQTVSWTALAATLGFALAQAALVVAAWRDTQRTTTEGRRVVEHALPPLWERLYLDFILLVVASAAFTQMATSGYEIVLSSEGVAQASIQYQAFLAPVCFWLGAALLTVRLFRRVLGHHTALIERFVQPIATTLATVVSASLSRTRTQITQVLGLIVLAFAFAASTAIFNTTYNAQTRIDAQLTNGADVTITGSTAHPPSRLLGSIRATPGVASTAPLQHRFAYVGNDLQDLFGIDAAHVGDATTISDAYFGGGNARDTLAKLAAEHDGLLVSAETASDFALRPGDRINLRMQFADHAFHRVPFRFVGIAREFPTAPKDSFLVANAAYVSRMTGIEAAETVLVRTRGNPASVAARLRPVVASLPGTRVRDIGEVERSIGSSLTAVDLRGLSQLELGFAVVLVGGATGLMLLLSAMERRRSFAILAAVGATSRQASAFLWSEAVIYLVGGTTFGLAIGTIVAQLLVNLLRGVFDPPPESIAVPLPYLAVTVTIACASLIIAVSATGLFLRRNTTGTLREF